MLHCIKIYQNVLTDIKQYQYMMRFGCLVSNVTFWGVCIFDDIICLDIYLKNSFFKYKDYVCICSTDIKGGEQTSKVKKATNVTPYDLESPDATGTGTRQTTKKTRHKRTYPFKDLEESSKQPTNTDKVTCLYNIILQMSENSEKAISFLEYMETRICRITSSGEHFHRNK